MRQISTEGFNRERDDGYVLGELAAAASAYANWSAWQADGHMPVGKGFRPTSWPKGWQDKGWKPSPEPRRNLVKAGALILAEIERLDRAATQRGDQTS
ncbi:hypothetical protein B4O83_12455 [Chromohalobacter israelensis]|nr:hypothetical protein B4O83_12455 [Chromohalobacter salexigens]